MSSELEQVTSGRVLACALCKQRRVKCSRTLPCTNCARAGVLCVQATRGQKRTRVTEREILDRLHLYEDLLRQNNVPFKPLRPSAATPSHDTHSARPRSNKDREFT
jgi:hypothetical protein